VNRSSTRLQIAARAASLALAAALLAPGVIHADALPLYIGDPTANEKPAPGIFCGLGEGNLKRKLSLATEKRWGNDYMHARYYSPNLGRFMSVDPIGGTVGSSQSWNRYSYVNNNPLGLVDPNGEIDFEVVPAAGSGYGAIALDAYADIITDPNTNFSQKTAAGVAGFFAALWTPETSLRTGPALMAAGGVSLARTMGSPSLVAGVNSGVAIGAGSGATNALSGGPDFSSVDGFAGFLTEYSGSTLLGGVTGTFPGGGSTFTSSISGASSGGLTYVGMSMFQGNEINMGDLAWNTVTGSAAGFTGRAFIESDITKHQGLTAGIYKALCDATKNLSD
jgi:RHS repeat-associated protein